MSDQSTAGGVRVTFLGTGGVNSVERSSAGIAVQFPSGETLLLDTCGGNEVHRQVRRAGIELLSIRWIVVTHQHYDHAAGFPLLVHLLGGLDKPLHVYGPASTVPLLRTLTDILCPHAPSRLGDRLQWHRCEDGERVALPGAAGRLSFFAVEHAVETLGVALEAGGRRLVYSADTGPCRSLVRAAAGADVLIHEASGSEADPGGAERTHSFGHSTAADAGRTAAAAGVGQLLLTHVGDASPERCRHLAAEAAQYYPGEIRVASDLDTFAL